MMSSNNDGSTVDSSVFVPPGSAIVSLISADVTAAPSTTFLTLTSGYYQAVNTGQGSSEEQPSVANSTRPGTTKTSSNTFQSATFSSTAGGSGSGPSNVPPSGSSETISTGKNGTSERGIKPLNNKPRLPHWCQNRHSASHRNNSGNFHLVVRHHSSRRNLASNQNEQD